jgi:RNA polymerase sigma-70 factor, ECF subfamily
MRPEPKPALRVGDNDLLDRARAKDEEALRLIIRQNNRRLFRLVRSIVGDEGEAEEVVQESYLRAFTHLAEFRGESHLGTWLTRIAINEAYGRLRRRRVRRAFERLEMASVSAEIIAFPLSAGSGDPEKSMAQHQIHKVLERAIDRLPEPFRVVVVARLVEEMSLKETADLLGLRTETIKTRLHRARKLLRDDLEKELGLHLTEVFPFAGARCERIADAVIAKLRTLG